MPAQINARENESTGDYDGLDDVDPEGFSGGYLDPRANRVIFE